jgi:hypothetical protein
MGAKFIGTNDDSESKHVWSKEQQARARGEGWCLATTINNGDAHPMWDIAAHGPKFKNDQTAALAVIAAAKTGSAFHQQTLKLVLDSRVRKAKT